MKEVIALRGTKNKGKSQIVKKVPDLLLAKYRGAKVENLIPQSRSLDIKVLITINEVKIGIESQGDPRPGRLPESITEFVKLGCDIIICATRTSGGTQTAVKNLKAHFGYDIVWLDQNDAGTSTSGQEAANQQMATRIVSEVEKSLSVQKAHSATP
jgi:hypothetical protein